MKKIDLTSMTYEQLCELETAITKAKSKFVSLRDVAIHEDKNNETHFCYLTCEKGVFRNSFYHEYYDFFTKELVDNGEWLLPFNDTLRDYLSDNGIEFEDRYYLKTEVIDLWNSIRLELENAKFDSGKSELDESESLLLTPKATTVVND